MDEIKIDIDYLLQIAGEDTEMVISIIDDFEGESMRLIARLEDLTAAEVDEGSLAEIGRVLHKFRGSSSSLGMISLSEVLVGLESWDLGQWGCEDFDALRLSEHLTKSVELCKGSLG
jgi:chemotaxis protein histidine kinase CheA